MLQFFSITNSKFQQIQSQTAQISAHLRPNSLNFSKQPKISEHIQSQTAQISANSKPILEQYNLYREWVFEQYREGSDLTELISMLIGVLPGMRRIFS